MRNNETALICDVLTHILATDIEGIFRLSGSAKRIKELQIIFDSPDRYGKGLDWTGYTVHDAANILRRYLNQLPQPIVPLEFYEQFREPLRSHQTQAVGDMDAEAAARDTGDFDHDAAIRTYQRLITELPPLNRQLLLYILDLLAVFASKSEKNLMTSPNLSAIFQPGMLSHPNHDMLPNHYRLSQDVIIFLIENQDSFLVGMSGTAADEKTVKEVQSGIQRQPNTPTRLSQAGLGRSASNASAGADSLRKQGGLRRNMSVSSKNSKASSNVPSPGSPAPGSPLVTTSPGGGVHRSNTVPSKKSPGIPSSRYLRNADSPTPTSTHTPSGRHLSPAPRTSSPGSRLAQQTSDTSNTASVTPIAGISSGLNPSPESTDSPARKTSREKQLAGEKLSLRTADQGVTTTITGGTPNRDRKTFFSKSPSSDSERKDARLPNKLRKKRIPEVSPNVSAQSSTHSLHGLPDSPSNPDFYTPMPTPGVGNHPTSDPLSSVPPTFSNTQATPSSETPPRIGELDRLSAFHVSQPSSSRAASPATKPSKSPVGSIHSVTEESELEHTDDGTMMESSKKRRRWRLSTSNGSNEKRSVTPGGSRLGSNAIAERSASSVLSEGNPRKSMTNESYPTQTGTEITTSSGLHHSSNESTPSKETARERGNGPEDKEKKGGPIGWLKAKVAHAKEERKEREAEKERAKSPPRNGSEHAASKHSLGAIAQDSLPVRGRSTTEAEVEGIKQNEREPTDTTLT